MTNERSDGYLAISAYAAIGDGRTVALVGRDGAVDWCCLPSFDAPAVLGRLLDSRVGGYFRVAPARPGPVTRRYVPKSNVLETRTEAPSGALSLTDTMPRGSGRLLRVMTAEGGDIDVDIELRPGFDYGQSRARVEVEGNRLTARCGGAWLECAAPAGWQEIEPGIWGCRIRLAEGTSALAELAWRARADTTVDQARLRVHEDVCRWRGWAASIEYDGPFGDDVLRSALALRLMVSEPHGALVAAATTSLPECVGGERNWDYRFTWLRDASLVLDAFMQLGMHDEAMSFWEWIERSDIADGGRPRVMYRIDGTTNLPERVLDGLDGYRGSRPVRTGNAAMEQDQLDVYGYVIDAAHACQTRMRSPHPDLAPVLRNLADQAANRWRQPDHGIWEVRGEPQYNVHSKVLCWVALSRAVALAERQWLDGDASRWADERDAIREDILARGWNPALGAFTQAYDSAVVDASALAIGNLGLLPATDERFVSTIDVIRRELERDGLVYRYRAPDGLSGDEGAFVICSFWLAEALARAGRAAEASDVFARVCQRANDVGLFSEQIDPDTGTFLGNMPQAFSHLALIRAALAIRDGTG